MQYDMNFAVTVFHVLYRIIVIRVLLFELRRFSYHLCVDCAKLNVLFFEVERYRSPGSALFCHLRDCRFLCCRSISHQTQCRTRT